jgi:hypothetical protein
MSRRRSSSSDNQRAYTGAEGWQRTSRKRDGRQECHRMNFLRFVLFPTERRHPSAAAACLGRGGRTVRRGGGRERGRSCHFLSSAATSRGPRRAPGHLPPPTNSSTHEGTVPPTPSLSPEGTGGGDSDGMGAAEGGGVVVKSIFFVCLC